jgi:argininosuccinate lyase
VREANLSFRQAHHLVAQSVQANPENDAPERIVDELLRLAPGIVPRDRLLVAVDPQKFVEQRTIPGGPGAAALEPELERAQRTQQELQDWAASRRAALETAHEELMSWEPT